MIALHVHAIFWSAFFAPMRAPPSAAKPPRDARGRFVKRSSDVD